MTKKLTKNKVNKMLITSYAFYAAFFITLFYEKEQTILLIIMFFLSSSLFILSAKKTKDVAKIQKNIKIVILLYSLILLYIVIFDKNYGRNGIYVDYNDIEKYLSHSINLIPFETISRYKFANTDFGVFFINIIGNILMLTPISVLYPIISIKKIKFAKIAVIGFLCSLFIETTQLLTLSGSFDIDDIILNFFGMTLFYVIFILKKINESLKKIIGITIKNENI